jgi:phage recombination protein Bet
MAKAATQTKEKPATEQIVDEQPQSKGEVAVFHAPRLPYHSAIQDRFAVDKGQWKVLVEAIFPAAQSVDAVVMALSYCQHRKLDVFKKPVHIVPMYDSKRGGYVETIWPSIAELRTTASRTKQYAGCDEAVFGPMKKQKFEGMVWENRKQVQGSVTMEYPEWCRITVHRIVNGVVCKFVGPKVVWLESYATAGKTDIPNTMWQERPEGQIEKCAEAAALRRAFPEELGNEYSAEEMEGRKIDTIVPGKEVLATTLVRDDGPPLRAAAKQDNVVDGEFTEATDGTKHDADGVAQETGSHVSGDPVDDMQDGDGSMDDEVAEDKPIAHEIVSTGMSFIQFADAYIAAVQTSKLPKDVLEFGSLNRKALDKVYARHEESATRIRKACEAMMMKLRNEAAAKKDDPISSGTAPKKEAAPKKDDGPPRRAAAKAKPVTVDPEDLLKQIKTLLDGVSDVNDLEEVWLEKCMPIYDTLDFPADKSAADAHYRKTEVRLGID